jgi:integrase
MNFKFHKSICRVSKLPPFFSVAALDWLKTRTGIAPSTERSYKLAISQLTKAFGKQLLCDISGEDLAAYQTRRKREAVSNRTVNLELGVLRSILRRYRMWEALAGDVDFLKESPSPGRALSHEEETALLDAASKSRCRSLYPVVMLALNTGMRASEIRGLRGGGWTFSPKASQWANPRRRQVPGASSR